MRTPILYTCQFTLIYGGVQQTLLDLLKYLDRSRFEPFVLCPPEGALPQLLSQQGVKVRTVGRGQYWCYTSRRPLSTLRDVLLVAREIVRLARAENICVVHTFFGMDFLAARLASLWVRDLNVIWFDCGFRHKPLYRLIARCCFGPRAQVVTLTRLRLQQLFAEGLAHERGAVLPAGTDFHLRDADHGATQPRETVRVGIIGRMEPGKDFETFLRAAALVAARHPQARFSIVSGEDHSTGASDYRRHLLELAETLRLTEQLTFHANTDDLLPLLSDFDVLVSASRAEAFGRTLVEAMALAKPIVATAVDGVPEVVADGEVGFLVPVGDFQAMAERISQLVADADLRTRLGRNGYARVRERFDCRAINRQWEELYLALAQPKGPRGAREETEQTETIEQTEMA
jgi:glycosyltransferase involved in cell wall biosynthesis